MFPFIQNARFQPMARMSLLLLVLQPCLSWILHGSSNSLGSRHSIGRASFFSMSAGEELFGENQVEFDSLIDTDVVIYSPEDDGSKLLLGALQEDGVLSPLSVWTTEPAFGDSIEFLVDEEDRFSLNPEKINLRYLLNEGELSYGSRQCKRGVDNPHGEESEILYYVEQEVLDKYGIEVTVRPDLEILW